MATYITLIRWTEQGIQHARETVDRVEQARAAVAQLGGRLTGVYWTQGEYDLVALSEFPDDETATAFFLSLGMLGNVRTQTLRAFGADEMRRILQRLPQR
jgi:uncharacterized protein with GYD domain